MEAKDTVKKVGEHSERIWCPHCGEEFGIESKVEYEREAQAEISFKAGQEAERDRNSVALAESYFRGRQDGLTIVGEKKRTRVKDISGED